MEKITLVKSLMYYRFGVLGRWVAERAGNFAEKRLILALFFEYRPNQRSLSLKNFFLSHKNQQMGVKDRRKVKTMNHNIVVLHLRQYWQTLKST